MDLVVDHYTCGKIQEVEKLLQAAERGFPTSKEWAITHNDYRTTTIHIRPIIDTCDNT
jgi:hypothetical protein